MADRFVITPPADCVDLLDDPDDAAQLHQITTMVSMNAYTIDDANRWTRRRGGPR